MAAGLTKAERDAVAAAIVGRQTDLRNMLIKYGAESKTPIDTTIRQSWRDQLDALTTALPKVRVRR